MFELQLWPTHALTQTFDFKQPKWRWWGKVCLKNCWLLQNQLNHFYNWEKQWWRRWWRVIIIGMHLCQKTEEKKKDFLCRSAWANGCGYANVLQINHTSSLSSSETKTRAETAAQKLQFITTKAERQHFRSKTFLKTSSQILRKVFVFPFLNNSKKKCLCEKKYER